MTRRISLVGGSISFAMVIFLNALGSCSAQGEDGLRPSAPMGWHEEEPGPAVAASGETPSPSGVFTYRYPESR